MTHLPEGEMTMLGWTPMTYLPEGEMTLRRNLGTSLASLLSWRC